MCTHQLKLRVKEAREAFGLGIKPKLSDEGSGAPDVSSTAAPEASRRVPHAACPWTSGVLDVI